MNAYAPNPPYSRSGPASLTASLLARKGEAAPAVDAEAHAGVDIAMSAMRAAPAMRATRRAPPDNDDQAAPYDVAPRGNVRIFRPRAPANANQRREGALNRPSDFAARARARRLALRKSQPADDDGRKASVTIRMPARDFVRLYHASQALDVTCRSIILDAVGAYLDANEITQLSDEECARELARLAKRMGRKASPR